MHDPLDDLLGPAFSPPPGGPLRRELLGRTTRALRRRHLRRRLGAAGVLVAAYAAGLLTVAAVTPPEPAAPLREVARSAQPPGPPVTPAGLEWRALERPAQAGELYRQAADRYLDEGDAGNAMRCYANALEEAGAGGLEVSPDDSWLLIAIKRARKKEEICAGK
jgi:hypothetical protein